LKSRTNPYSQP